MATPKSKSSTTKSKKSAKSRPKASRKRKGAPAPSKNIEIVITMILFFGFIIYGAGQCNKAKVAKEVAENPAALPKNESALTVETTTSLPTTVASTEEAFPADINPNQAGADNQINLPKLNQKEIVKIVENLGTAPGSLSGNEATAPSTQLADTLQKFNRLWVTMDQLKIRKEPNLRAEVLMQMPLFDRVYYLNQKSNFEQEINLGSEIAKEPWLLIHHANGTKGWAYGAGLNFHKQKRSGVN